MCVDLGGELGRTYGRIEGQSGAGLSWRGIAGGGDSVLLKLIDGEGGKEEGGRREGGEEFDIGRGGGFAARVNASYA